MFSLDHAWANYDPKSLQSKSFIVTPPFFDPVLMSPNKLIDEFNCCIPPRNYTPLSHTTKLEQKEETIIHALKDEETVKPEPKSKKLKQYTQPKLIPREIMNQIRTKTADVSNSNQLFIVSILLIVVLVVFVMFDKMVITKKIKQMQKQLTDKSQ